MKILISHSSKNANYGSALVELLVGVGVSHDEIIFTSDSSYGIPTGKNIFDWLKNEIKDDPFVIYLLSPEYYKSVACLNEMGAAWVIDNKHAMIFTPDFDLKSDYFQNGALDPREIGFRINDKYKLTEFIESLRTSYSISNKPHLVSKKIDVFIDEINSFSSASTTQNEDVKNSTDTTTEFIKSTETIIPSPSTAHTPIKNKLSPVERYFQDLNEGRLNDEEVMIIYYAADTASYRLRVGWQTDDEVNKIRNWEELNNLGNTLSEAYKFAIDRLELRTLTQVSDRTSYNNPKEVMLIDEMRDVLLDLPDEFYTKCDEIKQKSLEKMALKGEISFDDDIPF